MADSIDIIPFPSTDPIPPSRSLENARPPKRFWPLVSWVLRLAALVIFAGLILRVVFVEPFSVPSASMAPGLLGRHFDVACPDCRIPLSINSDRDTKKIVRRRDILTCPNCRARFPIEEGSERPGDRVIVDKFSFDVRPPMRWELAVFNPPVDEPTPYVKRIVGLPGERVRIREGEVLIDGEIARKSLNQCRDIRVNVVDMRFAPPQGWAESWQPEIQDLPARTPWLDGSELVFPVESARGMRWMNFTRLPVIGTGLVNNCESEPDGPPAHDFMVSLDLIVQRGTGAVAIAVNDGADEAVALLRFGEPAPVRLSAGVLVQDASIAPLQFGRRYKVELSFFDRRALLAIDGEQVGEGLDLPFVPKRPINERTMRIGAQTVTASVSNLRLFRDVYYTEEGRHGVEREYQLGSSEYFMLGDNSRVSDDSRTWKIAAVPENQLIGRPLLRRRAVDGWGRWSWIR